jgi:hypothetical protein
VTYHCCDPRRLEVIEHGSSNNAIESLELLDRGAPAGVPPQRTLFVRLLRPGFALQAKDLTISGGERIETVGIAWFAAADALPAQAEAGLVDGIAVADRGRTLVVRTDSAGDASIYTFAIGNQAENPPGPTRFDPKLSAIRFSFKVECPSPFDCLEPRVCPPEPQSRPRIDYLAKDYQGFRRLMLDRLSLLVPGWAEQSAADLGVVLVELLAYAADNLSYQQDVIANEAYLHTARQRRSVRRHARLVDYNLHEGCNARAFVHFEVDEQLSLPAGTELLTKTPGLANAVVKQDPADRSKIVRDAVASGAQVFLTAQEAALQEPLNEIRLYTWGNRDCCLPRGSIAVTLRGKLSELLTAGAFLLFEEIRDPKQPSLSSAELADKSHRWVVRLTRVSPAEDPSGKLFDDPPSDAPVDLTEIEWDAADALPFPLCISAEGVETAVARGNVLLVDHGLWIEGEALGEVPPEGPRVAPQGPSATCREDSRDLLPLRFYPALERGPLTHGFGLPGLLSMTVGNKARWPASALCDIQPKAATPRITLLGQTPESEAPATTWEPRGDLLDSGAEHLHFVVEVEDDGRARLRFGDDQHGKRPNPRTAFIARYRVGNGSLGNVGTEAIAHVVTGVSGVVRARNPLPASGGVDPEDIEVARRDAPQAFRTQERAVTAADYAALTERLPDVQRATARFRWTGSWHTVFVTADRFGGAKVEGSFAARLREHLERFRMAGYDLHADNPRYVPLDISVHVCVSRRYARARVLREVKRVLSSSVLPDGTLGLFHPDSFSFGSPVYLSRMVAAVQTVTGVDSVRVDRFQRLVNPDPTSLLDGVIPIGPLEIAQLENSPNFPELGRLRLYAGDET